MYISPQDTLMQDLQRVCAEVMQRHEELFGLGEAKTDHEWWSLLDLLTMPESRSSLITTPILHEANANRNNPVRMRVLVLTLLRDVLPWEELLNRVMDPREIQQHLVKDNRNWHTATTRWEHNLPKEGWFFIRDWLLEVMPLLDRYYLARSRGRRNISELQWCCRHHFFYLSQYLPMEELRGFQGNLPLFWEDLGANLERDEERDEGWDFNKLLLTSANSALRDLSWQQLRDSLLPPDQVKAEIFQDLRCQIRYWELTLPMWNSFMQIQAEYLAVSNLSLAAAFPFSDLVAMARKVGGALDVEQAKKLVCQNIPHTSLAHLRNVDECECIAALIQDDPGLDSFREQLLSCKEKAQEKSRLHQLQVEAFATHKAQVLTRLGFVVNPM